MHLLELTEHAARLCGSYSFGMKRKLALAGALVHQPSVLLLDEPLNGLDPRSTRRLKDLFLNISSRGTTILLSTHDLATAGEICDRIGIIHRGKLLAEGSADELQHLAVAPDLESVFLNLTAVRFLSANYGTGSCSKLALQELSSSLHWAGKHSYGCSSCSSVSVVQCCVA